MNKIDKFEGDAAFLSNFYPVIIEYDSLSYPSAEHAFQSAKIFDPELKIKIASCETPGKAKKLGKQVPLRPDWEAVKDEIMYQILVIKFKHPDLRQKLIATHNLELIEGNHWGDTYWGICGGVGLNQLGQILMKIRADLILKT